MDDKDIENLIKDHNNENNNNMDKLVDFVQEEGPNYMIYGQYSLLITAVSYNQYDITELFLDMGANIDLQNPRGETSLYIACTQNDKSIDLLLLLLNRGAKINEVIRFGATTALKGVITYGNLEKVKILLEYGADPNLGDKHNNRPLQSAAMENVDMVKILLEYGSDINGTNVRNITALFFACLDKNINNINILLEYGADPFILDIENMNILNNNMLDIDIKTMVKKKINELHKLNVSYDMVEIAKGIHEDILDELTDDVLNIIYDYLINIPYNAEKTRLRMEEDLQDIRMSRFVTDIQKYGGRKRKKTNRNKKYGRKRNK